MMIKAITENDPLIEWMCSDEYLTTNMELFKKFIQFMEEHLHEEFSNVDVYIWLYDKKPELNRKTYNPQYRAIQLMMQHFRRINLLDCVDIKARGYGVRLICSLSKHNRYWIMGDDNKKTFVKLHELRNLVTRGRRSWEMEKTKAFKRYVSLYFNQEHG